MNDIQAAEVLARLDERVEILVKTVVGNGQPGLVQKVEDLEAHKNKLMGALAVLGAVGSFLWGGLEYLFHYTKR